MWFISGDPYHVKISQNYEFAQSYISFWNNVHMRKSIFVHEIE